MISMGQLYHVYFNVTIQCLVDHSFIRNGITFDIIAFICNKVCDIFTSVFFGKTVKSTIEELMRVCNWDFKISYSVDNKQRAVYVLETSSR